MIQSGLASVTFRQLEPHLIVDLARRAGLRGIEWGGDIHLPPGDERLAERLGAMTRDAGLAVSSYGSYYRAGVSSADDFQGVLAAAVCLGAPLIRIWAGSTPSAVSDAAARRRVIDDSRRIALEAGAAGVRLAFEYHSGTLTDEVESAVALMRELQGSGVGMYWQPPERMPVVRALEGLNRVCPWLCHIHVFHWCAVTAARLPLAEGEGVWDAYLRSAQADGVDRYALLEFVAGDDAAAMMADAAVLKRLLKEEDD